MTFFLVLNIARNKVWNSKIINIIEHTHYRFIIHKNKGTY